MATATVHLPVGWKQQLGRASSPPKQQRREEEAEISCPGQDEGYLLLSKLAGIRAAKMTSTMIPLCHNINLTKVSSMNEGVPATWGG